MGMQRPLPETDTDAAPFWKGAAQGKLMIQRCTACGQAQHYARPFCVKCRSAAVEMVEASGRGTVYSYTVIHRGPYDDIATPYVVALIRLEEGPTLLSHVIGCDLASVTCDLAVEVSYQSLTGEVVLPVFGPVQRTTAN
jgi:uncharacterized OB-fold protein